MGADELGDAWLQRRAKVKQAFSPRAPVNDRELFAGRNDELLRLFDVTNERGQHAVVYGERGVGKTSLATISASISAIHEKLALRLNCSRSDNLTTIARKIIDDLDDLTRLFEHPIIDGNSIEAVAEAAASQLIQQTVSTADFRAGLQALTDVGPVVIYIDEFDRVVDQDTKTQLVDLIKTLSDHAVPVTIVLVGVADTVSELIHEHRSIARCIDQIEMPRMSTSELSEIVKHGLDSADMRIEYEPMQRIVKLSQGLPHYTHLLAQEAALSALARSRDIIQEQDLSPAIDNALSAAEETVESLYYSATQSTQQNIYREVLLACAMAEKDDRGYFAPGDVREPLSSLMGRRYEIPQFARHLTQFSSSRGPVLQRTEGARPKYRFVEPLLIPYILMKGISDGFISESLGEYRPEPRQEGS